MKATVQCPCCKAHLDIDVPQRGIARIFGVRTPWRYILVKPRKK